MIRHIIYTICLVSTFLRASDLHALEPLPPEQESAFNNSVHGFLDCTDCHFPGQPDQIPRSKIPLLCADCHPKPFDDYIQSIHWKEKNPEAVCVDCHGVHNILLVNNPESISFRSLVCGGCHIGPKENFDRSPHKEGMENLNALACSSCHSNHNVQPPSIAGMEESCAQCHPKASPAFAMGQRVKVQLASVRDTFALAHTAIAAALDLGLNVRRPQQSILEARSSLSNVLMVWHSLDEEEIEDQVKRTSQTAKRAMEQAVDLTTSRRNRRIGLGIAWGFILVNILLLHLKRKKLESS